MSHTPAPWNVFSGPNGHVYIEAKGCIEIARMASANMLIGGDARSNAARIVQAVNAHDLLVAACREVANGYSTRGSEMARAALAAAGAA